jgi:hypothetical protein
VRGAGTSVYERETDVSSGVELDADCTPACGNCRETAAFVPPRVSFERLTDADTEPACSLLGYPHTWFVSWMGGCSCGFRHFAPGIEHLGATFGAPEDRCPEDDEEIENTRHLYRVISGLVRSGHAVECLDVLEGTPPEQVVVLDVVLADVPEGHLRPLENSLLRFARADG